MLDRRNAESSGVLCGKDAILRFVLEGLVKLRRTYDLCLDSTGLSFFVTVKPVRKAMDLLQARGVKVRIITDVMQSSLSYCKQATAFSQISHLAGVKGNFSISDGQVYVAASAAGEGQPFDYLFHSNASAVALQQEYFFDFLWEKAKPARDRIREVEEGFEPYQTRILSDPNAILRELRRKNLASEILAVCATPEGMKMSYQFLWDTYLRVLEREKATRSNGSVRWISSIGNENLELAKRFLSVGIAFKHVNNLPPMSFGMNEREIHATIDRMEGGRKVQSLLASTEPAYVEHFHSIFEDLWNGGVDAAQRIREIESGAKGHDIEILRNPSEALSRAWKLAAKARKEVLLMFSTTTAFQRQLKMGAMRVLAKAARSGSTIKILLPEDDKTRDLISKLEKRFSAVQFRVMDRSLQTRISLLLVDGKECMIFELRDDKKSSSIEAVGLSLYSGSPTIVQSYASIFDNLWTQTELYEHIRQTSEKLADAYTKLEAHDELQKDFINIAAHELRTPIQPILSIAESLALRMSSVRGGSVEVSGKEIEMLMRNISRLRRLTECILDLTRIESRTMVLNKQEFSLEDEINEAISEIRTGMPEEENARIRLRTSPGFPPVRADRTRIFQVVSNLLRNATKFKRDGEPVKVDIRLRIKGGNVIVSARDYGRGIDADILPRLFTKFATKSETGMGLGLYISKSIIEAHGGRMWATNAGKSGGATFSFTLPVLKSTGK